MIPVARLYALLDAGHTAAYDLARDIEVLLPPDGIVLSGDEVARRQERLREVWSGIETLRGYQACLSNGCGPMQSRGRSFGAHIDAVLDKLRAALALLDSAGEETG